MEIRAKELDRAGVFCRADSSRGVADRSLSSRENLRASVSLETDNNLVIVISVSLGLDIDRQSTAESGHKESVEGLAPCADRRSSLFRQLADIDRARSCQDCNFKMICLYDICDVARAVRDDIDASLTTQAVED